MAQTKRKRRTKHRGNAAGTIEARGRTGRRPTAAEKKQDDRAAAREKRLSTVPTWRSAAKRASIAAVLMFVFLMLTSKGALATRLIPSVILGFVAFGLYASFGYYMDMYLYRRRMRKKAAEK
jgi:hypothetical protein